MPQRQRAARQLFLSAAVKYKEEGDIPYNYADSKGLTFYKTDNISEDQHAGAVEFVKWVYNKDNSAQTDLDWLNATTMLPVRGDLNDNEVFAEVM